MVQEACSQGAHVVQVWQAILVKKVDLDSKQAQAMMSEGARHLLKVLALLRPPCGHDEGDLLCLGQDIAQCGSRKPTPHGCVDKLLGDVEEASPGLLRLSSYSAIC